jgi:hypothetical protein
VHRGHHSGKTEVKLKSCVKDTLTNPTSAKEQQLRLEKLKKVFTLAVLDDMYYQSPVDCPENLPGSSDQDMPD